jgi:hypothetical protein
MGKVVFHSTNPFTPEQLKEFPQRGWEICKNPSSEAIELFKEEMKKDSNFALYYGYRNEGEKYLDAMAKDAVRLIQYKQSTKR